MSDPIWGLKSLILLKGSKMQRPAKVLKRYLIKILEPVESNFHNQEEHSTQYIIISLRQGTEGWWGENRRMVSINREQVACVVKAKQGNLRQFCPKNFTVSPLEIKSAVENTIISHLALDISLHDSVSILTAALGKARNRT